MDLIQDKIKRQRIKAIIISTLLVTFYFLEGQYAAFWFIVFLLIGLFLIPVFLIGMIKALLSGIKNRKTAESFNPFLIYVLAIIIAYCLPGADHSKQYYKWSVAIDTAGTKQHGKLYLESYLVATGFLSTNVNAEYLTDNKSFRLFLGTCDEDGHPINLKFVGDSVIVTNWEDEPRNSASPYATAKIVEKRTFNLTQLQQQHVFE